MEEGEGKRGRREGKREKRGRERRKEEGARGGRLKDGEGNRKCRMK